MFSNRIWAWFLIELLLQLAKIYVGGVERVETRCITGQTNYNSCRGFTVLDLPAGTHSVQVRVMFCLDFDLLTVLFIAQVPFSYRTYI